MLYEISPLFFLPSGITDHWSISPVRADKWQFSWQIKWKLVLKDAPHWERGVLDGAPGYKVVVQE